MMKFAHNRHEDNVRRGIKKSPFSDWVWMLALVIIILGNIFNVLAIDFGNPLLLATSSCISICFTTTFCVCFLKEKLFCNRIIAIFVILFGSALFLSRAKNPDLTLTQQEIFALYQRPISLVYITVQVILVTSFMALFFRIKGNMHRFIFECQKKIDPKRELSNEVFQHQTLVNTINSLDQKSIGFVTT